MTWLQLGNTHAREAYRDSHSDDPEQVHHRVLDGHQVTCLVFPDDLSLMECMNTTAKVVTEHFASQPEDGSDQPLAPVWVESSSPQLAALVVDHFGVTEDRPQDVADHPQVAQLKSARGGDRHQD